MERYLLLSFNKFLSPSNRFLLNQFSREAIHSLARDGPHFFFSKEIPQHLRRFLEREASAKIARMVPRKTYRFTSKPFDMYARRRPLVSELFTGVSKIGTRRVHVIRLALSRETPRKS